MPYNVKRNKSINAKFRAMLVQNGSQFIDSETGEVCDLAKIVSKTIGDGQPVDIQIKNVDEEDITPTDAE